MPAADDKGEFDSNGGDGGSRFEGVMGGFFFAANGRNIDHSDSNLTESNSERSGVCSSSAGSKSSSIFLSALRMIKTKWCVESVVSKRCLGYKA